MRILNAMLALCLFGTGYAQDKEVNLTRASAVCIALQNNLELRALNENIDAAFARLEQSGRLENPELGIAYGNDFLFNNEGEDAFEISISQKFPLFGRLSKEEDIAKIDIELAKLEYEQAKRDLSQQVEIEYINCLRLGEILVETKKEITLVSDIKDFLYSSYKKAEGSSLDYLSTENEYESLKLKLEQNSLDLETSLLSLKALMGIDIEKNLALGDSLDAISIAKKEFSEQVLSSRLDYQILLLAKKSVKAQIALISAEKFEDIEVGIFLETSNSCDVPVGLKRESALGISLKVPLPFKSSKSSVSEQLANRRKIENLLFEKELQIKKEIKIYSMRASKLEEILKGSHSNLLSSSLDVYNKYLDSYKMAKVSLNEVFATWQSHLNILESDIDLKAEQAINTIKLNYSLGIFEYEK